MTNISYSLGEGESIYTDITIIGNNISIKISLYDDKTTFLTLNPLFSYFA
jgi:hypothetical protein